MESILNKMILLCLDLAASLASCKGSLLHAILKLNALSIGPGDVVAEAVPVLLEVRIDVVW